MAQLEVTKTVVRSPGMPRGSALIAAAVWLRVCERPGRIAAALT